MAKKRIGILTSGGDCPGLNAAIRGVAKAAYEKIPDVEIIGIVDGYSGLIHGESRVMKQSDFSGILTLGGTILGTSRQPFKTIRVIGEASLDKVATDAIDRIHTTAASHGRVMVVELMGHKAGWLTLYAGIAGGADIIILPEIPFDMDAVVNAVARRAKNGKLFSIVAVAEGALDTEEAKLKKKQRAAQRAERGEKTASERIARAIEVATGMETRTVVPGHVQRGGSPCAYDRVLSTQFGVYAANLIANDVYGVSVAVANHEVTHNPLSEIAGKTKFVTPDCQMVRVAQNMGISFGSK